MSMQIGSSAIVSNTQPALAGPAATGSEPKMSPAVEGALRNVALAGSVKPAETVPVNTYASIKASTVPHMGAEGVLAKARELMPDRKSELGAASVMARVTQMVSIAADEKAPPDLRSFMMQSIQVLGGQHNVQLDSYQKKDLDVLKQHPEAFPLNTKNLQSKIDDPSTPPDLKAALNRIKQDPNMRILLDTGAVRGGGIKEADDKIVFGDVNGLLKTQELIALAAQQPKSIKPAKTDSKVETEPTADGPAAILRKYKSETGNHIKPDGTLDLPGIRGDYSASPEVREAARNIDHTAADDERNVGLVTTPMQTVKLKSAETVLVKPAETVLVKPADVTVNADAAKAAMNANLDRLADHMSGSSDLSKEDFQKIADGTYGSLDNIGELNAADRQKLKAGAKHITENFDKFDVAYEGKDANSRVSALDIRGFTDPKKTVDGINASNTLLGKDTSVPDDKKAVVKENLSALANHLSGNSNSSLEDFQKIAAGVFSPLDHDIRVENADEAKIMAGAKYVTENFDNFDTAQLGRQSNGGVSPDNIRGYTDTNVKDFDDEDQSADEGAISS